MSLEKWAANAWLRPEPTSPDEIVNLMGIVTRGIADAKVEAISVDLRFIAAFNAALTAATVALRACGYRTPSQPGHHTRAIESLELTIQADPRLIQKLKVLSNKRNKSSYDAAGTVSDQELALIRRIARELRDQVQQWLEKNHPQLLKS